MIIEYMHKAFSCENDSTKTKNNVIHNKRKGEIK